MSLVLGFSFEQVASNIEVVSSDSVPKVVKEDAFDPSKFNVDTIDNELALLDSPNETDLVENIEKYRSIT